MIAVRATSIQARLTLWLGVTMAILSFVTGGALFAYLHHAMLRQFDDSLALRAHALQSLITQKAGGDYDVDVDPAMLPEYRYAGFREYFRITNPAGNVLVTSTREAVSLDGPVAENFAQDIELPHGTHARGLRMQFVPQMEREDDPAAAAALARPRVALTLVVARERRPLDTALTRIGLAIAAATALLSLVTLAATVLIVRAALRAMRGLATEMAAIDFARPGARFVAPAVPRELEPIVVRFNDMLGRIATTLSREKRFTADVAHELRTPIAELRSAAEVALRAPHDRSAAERTVTQAYDIAVQMQTVVTTLLAIARETALSDNLTLTAVQLWPMIEQVVARQAPRQGETVLVRPTGPGPLVRADAALLRAVLENLIGNAFDHAVGVGPIHINVAGGPDAVRLQIENDHATLTPADLPQMFDPFWRKDAARSDGRHVGLGMTLTQTYCTAMGFSLVASLPVVGRFRIELTLPREASGETARVERAAVTAEGSRL